MTSQPLRLRALCAIFLTFVAAAPLLAAAKKRAVARPAGEKITVTGLVVDANTGAPLKGALVTSGAFSAISDDNGNYTLSASSGADISASRVGYVTLKKSVSGNEVNFTLAQTPSVTLKLTNGGTVVLDYDTTEFGYSEVFTYIHGPGLSLCKSAADPTWDPLKGEFKKIVGPAHPVTNAGCCDRGPVNAIDITLKTGETLTAYLKDNCFGYENDVLGVERSSAQLKYFHLKDVAEIDFP